MRRSDVRPRKTPRQARSLETVELILTAAARVLGRDSLAGFNTNRVARVAGISVGSLYQYFPNKEALVCALIDRSHAELLESMRRVVAESEGASLEATLRALARLAIDQQYSNALLAAALDHEERRLPIGDRLQAFGVELSRLVHAILARHADELPRDLPAAAGADCMVITRALVEADAEAGRAPAPDLEARILRALWGYLRPVDVARRARPARRRGPGSAYHGAGA